MKKKITLQKKLSFLHLLCLISVMAFNGESFCLILFPLTMLTFQWSIPEICSTSCSKPYRESWRLYESSNWSTRAWSLHILVICLNYVKNESAQNSKAKLCVFGKRVPLTQIGFCVFQDGPSVLVRRISDKGPFLFTLLYSVQRCTCRCKASVRSHLEVSFISSTSSPSITMIQPAMEAVLLDVLLIFSMLTIESLSSFRWCFMSFRPFLISVWRRQWWITVVMAGNRNCSISQPNGKYPCLCMTPSAAI